MNDSFHVPKTGQFKKPGIFIHDAPHSEPVSKRETPSVLTASPVGLLPQRQTQDLRAHSPVGLLPRRQTQGLRVNWFDDAVLLDKDVSMSLSAEADNGLDFIDSRKTVVVPVLEELLSPQATRKVASPPYARTRTTLATVTRQYIVLLRILLAEYRTVWFFHVFNGVLLPISLAFVIIAVGGAASRDAAVYLLGGNMAFSIATGPAAFLIGKFGWAKQGKEFHYWIALPIPKLSLVLAIILVSVVFALPGVLCIYVFGSLLLKLPFTETAWALFALIPLGVLPLTGVGALMGISAPNIQVASILSNVLVVFVGILSPVMLPLSALPLPLQVIAPAMPTTYVADAFRAVLGEPGTHLTFDLIILVFFSTVFLTVTYFLLDWRNA